MITRLLGAAAIAALVFGSVAIVPGRAAAAAPSPDQPRRVTFEAGRHAGYRFSEAGTVSATKSATLSRPSGASTTRRTTIAGRGVHLYIVDGIWAGYYVPESVVAYVAGVVGGSTWSPTRRISFPAGTVIGYRFDASWAMTSARIGSLGRDSGASADRTTVINGRRYFRIIDGGWAGTWVPAGSGSTARPLGCRTGTRADASLRLVRRANAAGPEIALTFDMGGRLDPALSIMRYLLLNGVCATIFPTGEASLTTTGQQVLAMVRAYPQVFEVGNHTMYHCNLVTGGEGVNCPTTRPSTTRMKRELIDAAAIIQAGSGQSPIPYWRPPYGAYDSAVLSTAASIGYTSTLMWDVDTIDWRPPNLGGPSAPAIVSKVVGNAVDGSVVLMHLGGYNTRDALPSMILHLRADRALTPTTISDLLDLP